ncbi:MarR family transcriptional regulator, partial [Candidatus Woesearchaeota archaeon]|nr:MarR family transcriptional regulator [Candidatus Woesearchaeota archaeon]
MIKFGLFFLFLSVLLVSAGLVNAATIHGTIYDLSLRKLSNVRVEINTSPKQFLVAQ